MMIATRIENGYWKLVDELISEGVSPKQAVIDADLLFYGEDAADDTSDC